MTRGVVAVVAGAGVLVVAGVVLVVTSAPVTFGWFAYAPLSGQRMPTALDHAVVLSRQQGVGALAVVVGVAVLAAALGYAVGRRRPRSSSGARAGGRDPSLDR